MNYRLKLLVFFLGALAVFFLLNVGYSALNTISRPDVVESERGETPGRTDMTFLTAFGLIAVALMLVFYALERRSRWYTLAFAGACALGSVYGFLQGAWPFGLVEAVWFFVAFRRWWLAAESSH